MVTSKTMVRMTCLLAAILLGACAAPAPPVTYYSLLDAERQLSNPSMSTQSPAVSIGPASAPDLLKRARIAFSSPQGELTLSDAHRWMDDLDRECARALALDLALRLGTEQVALFPEDHHLPAHFRVPFDILALDGAPGAQARLVVRWSLIVPGAGTATLIRTEHFSRRTASEGPAAWVEAQRANIGALGEAISREILRLQARP